MSEVLPGDEQPKKRGRKPGTKNAKNAASDVEIASLAKGFQLLYEVPVFLNYGNHWRINETDATLAAGAFYEAAGSVESKLFQQIMRYMRELMPWFAFCFIMYTLTKPRLEKTMVLLNERSGKARTNQNFTNSDNVGTQHSDTSISDVEARFDDKSSLIS